VIFTLLACEAPLVTRDSPDPAPSDGVEHLEGLDPVEDTGTEPGPDALFNLDEVHTLEVTLGRTARNELARDPYTYVEAEVTLDGQRFPLVGVRAKGRLGSSRGFDGKVALKLDFREFGGDSAFGLDKLNVNNMVQDCSKVHEVAAYAIHRSLGTPAPRVAYARVTIDGEDYGLYSLVEDYDDEFLQANFADPTGNLYDGDYYLPGDGSYILLDFNAATQDLIALDEGVDVGHADIHAVTDATAGGIGAVASVVDLDQHAAFLAATAWTGHYDSYGYYSNNYRVYFDPGRGGRAVFMPWDPDWAFYTATDLNAPYSIVTQLCLADVSCRERVRTFTTSLSESVPGSAIATDVERAIALVQDPLRTDPRLETGLRDIRACQDDLLDWFDRRGAELAAVGW
jgi:hypothetical protein